MDTRDGAPGPGARYDRFLLPTVMAVVMSLVMSLMDAIGRVGWAPGLVAAWLSSFAGGVVVAVPAAIVIGPQAQRLVAQVTRNGNAL